MSRRLGTTGATGDGRRDVSRARTSPRGSAGGVARSGAARSRDPRPSRPPGCGEALDLSAPLPESGTDPAALLERTARLLFEHSLFNAHPRFFGYITAAPAPIGILGDFLAAAVNANVGAWTLSPAATEIEAQTVRWIASLIGYPARLRRPARERRQHGEHRLLPGRARREGRLERARARRRSAIRATAPRLRLGRNAHLDSEGRRPRRARHRRRSGGFRPTASSAWTSPRCAGRSRQTAQRATCRAWSSAPPGR